MPVPFFDADLDTRGQSGEFHSLPLTEIENTTTRSISLSVTFDGAQKVEPTGMDLAETYYNFFLGEESMWREGVSSYTTVAYPDLYDGIDLFTFGQRDSLKYEFHVSPGTDYTQIEISYTGSDGLWIDELGQLHVGTEFGDLVDDAPYIYQTIDGQQVEVAGQFALIDADTYTFTITDDYDPTLELVIDPDLDWSTYLGGSSHDYGSGIAVDPSGNALVTGSTYSTDFSGANNAYQGNYDPFVAKVSSGGTLQWATYLGGSSWDLGTGIAVDPSGNALVSGHTDSTDFSRANNAFKGGGWDAFVAKIYDKIPGDANKDGVVDGSDATILATYWQAGVPGGDPSVTWSMGDFNGDYMVDGSDATILASHWQEGITCIVAVSGPVSMSIPGTLLVDADASTGGDGFSWGTAYNDLQAALTQAAVFNTDGDTTNDVDQIWIAEGTYYPSAEYEPGDARSASFSLIDNVTLYGGFTGLETTLEERDFTTHTTTLSGDLGVIDDISDNAYMVLYCGVTIEAMLDGLSIVHGNANGNERARGGGICTKGILTVTNSTFLDNSSTAGGAIYNENMVTVTNSMFFGNSALASSDTAEGGAIFNNEGTLIVNSSTFSENSAGVGGGICSLCGTVTITNSTFSNNQANLGGGVCGARTEELTITNSTFFGNHANRRGGGICVIDSSSIINNTIVAGNTADDYLPDISIDGAVTSSHNLIGDGSGQGQLVDGVDGNQVGTDTAPIDPMLDENGCPLARSPAIDAGSNAMIPAGVIIDKAGNYRINDGTVDIGAYEFDSMPIIPGDANTDQKVDGSDATILASYWQVGVNDGQTATWSMGDFNRDGKVDGSDATILASHWQEGTMGTVVAVSDLTYEPEPTSQLEPPAGMSLGVATVPTRSSLPSRRFITPIVKSVDAIFTETSWNAIDRTAIAKELASVSVKKSKAANDAFFALKLDLYADPE